MPSEVRYCLHNGMYENPTQHLYNFTNIDLLQASTKTSYSKDFILVIFPHNGPLIVRHRASCILGQAFHYSPENAFYIFNQQIYFII